jgi:hypothetical protein
MKIFTPFHFPPRGKSKMNWGVSKKSNEPPRPPVGGHPSLERRGKYYYTSYIFLLLIKEESPDRSVRGRWLAF